MMCKAPKGRNVEAWGANPRIAEGMWMSPEGAP